MKKTVKVDLHCHSTHSDGIYSPKKLASVLSDSDIEIASLTDHDTLAGQHEFHQALSALGIGFISGIEITTYFENRNIHILGYGFEIENIHLTTKVSTLRNLTNSAYYKPQQLSTSSAIDLIHSAGGIAILAHPTFTEPNIENLLALIDQLCLQGLDGVEVPNVSDSQYNNVIQYVSGKDIILSSGSDFHGNSTCGPLQPGTTIDISLWKPFRDKILKAANLNDATRVLQDNSNLQPTESVRPNHWHSFALHIISPTVIALALFITILFQVVLPSFEHALMERKREMIRELTNAAISMLNEAHDEEISGESTREQAQHQAASRVESMRYGRESKDYFWIQDLFPKMIMHPYRSDLNGTDLSSFTDTQGNTIFKKFAEIVRINNEGYVQYVWQWKDDPDRFEPKESYVRLFKPWNWVIGTGIYINDVKEEINRYRKHLSLISAAVVSIVTLLLLYAMRGSIKLESKRAQAERSLLESTNRYKILVEAATEGALFMHGTRCRYANPAMMAFIGCDDSTIEVMDLEDIFPINENNTTLHEMLSATSVHPIPETTISSKLRRKDSAIVDCSVTIRTIPDSTTNNCMLLVRHIDHSKSDSTFTTEKRIMVERLLRIPVPVADTIIDEIKNASTFQSIIERCRKTPALTRSLLDVGASPPAITALLSAISDAATQQFITLTMNDIGEAPVSFCFCALGSQGRREQTIFTDQDNAIIYSINQGDDESQVQKYFKTLSTTVCDGLNRSGYAQCHGQIMASNPKWCQSLEQWKKYFESWIQNSSPHELMEFSVFFDFRAVSGDNNLAETLRSNTFEMLKASPWFYPYYAQNALQFKAPLRLFGTFVATPSSKEQHGKLDLKATMIPIVSFARLYSIKNESPKTNTLERLDALATKGVLLESKKNDIVSAYDSLLLFRLRHQIETVEENRQINNCIDPSRLGHIELAVLHECFKEIDSIQNRIKLDFLGGG